MKYTDYRLVEFTGPEQNGTTGMMITGKLRKLSDLNLENVVYYEHMR